jgi:hypothetical protein
MMRQIGSSDLDLSQTDAFVPKSLASLPFDTRQAHMTALYFICSYMEPHMAQQPNEA